MKKILSLLLALFLCATFSTASFAEGSPLFVSDGADLLSDEEESALSQRLQGISEALGAQICVVTEPTLDGADIETYAGSLYDGQGYGYGDDAAGVLLLVSMENPRKCWILGNGFAAVAVDNVVIESILDAIVPDLTAGNYASSFGIFADECEYYLNAHVNGVPFEVGGSLLIALVIGVIVGFVYVMILKGQLKSVKGQSHANVYVKDGSMRLTQSGDYFMYRNVTKTAKPQNNSSTGPRGGGSSRSGGGRSF